MRICVFSERLAPPFDEGFKNVAWHLIREFSTRHETLALTCFGQDIPAQGIRDIPANRLLLSLPLRRTIARFRPDLLYYIPTASTTPFSFFRAWMLRAFAGRAQVAMIALQPRPLRPLLSSFIRWLAPDLLLTACPQIAASLPLLPCPVAQVPLGVDLDRFRPGDPSWKPHLRRKYGLDEQGWFLLHVGHIKRERNVQVLARLRVALGCQVLVVGSTSTRQEADLVEELRATEVHIISEHIDVVEAYHLADGYVFPVLSETAAIGIPLSVLEAMACNLPIVSTPFGGLPELLPARPEDGFWYATDEEEIIARVRDMRAWGRAETRAMVAPYGWSQVTEQILRTTLCSRGQPFSNRA